MAKHALSYKLAPKPPTDYYVTSTNIKGVETYAPPREAFQFLSDLKKLEFLHQHQDRATYRAQLGAVTIENLVTSMMGFDGDNDTLQTQYKDAAERKYHRKPFFIESEIVYWGGIGEYAAYRMFEKLQGQSDYTFQYERASLEEDLSGIDAWVTPDNQLAEFQTTSGEQARLAVAIKHVMNVPAEINDIIFPLRDVHDLDAIVDGLGADLQCYSSPDYSWEQLLKCRSDVKKVADAAFWRFQGYAPDTSAESGWQKKYPSISEIYGDGIVPTFLLVSKNNKRNGETLVDLEDLYTLESQLTDNPDKWS